MRIRINASLSSPSSATVIGTRPTNSGISPNFTRSCGVTSAYSSPALRSTLEEICALKPMLFCPVWIPRSASMPSKAAAADEQNVRRVNRNQLLLRVLPSALGGTLATVPSMIFSSACCTPSPETSRVIDTFSLFLRDLVDFIQIYNTELCPFNIIISRLNQL